MSHKQRGVRSGIPGGSGGIPTASAAGGPPVEPPEAAGARAAPAEHGSADLFDWPAIRSKAAFIWAAPRRHQRLAGATFGTCLLLAILAATCLPRTYRTECRIQASRNLIMPALNNPGRAIPLDADMPTRGAAVSILRRESLLTLVKQTNLLERWKQGRPLLLKFKDGVTSIFAGKPDEEARLDSLVYTLEQKFKITTDDNIITIQVDWQDAQTAYLLVSTAQQDFLETRHALEVSTIAEAISILEGHAVEVQARVEADSQALRAVRGSPYAAPAAAPRAASAAAAAGKAKESADLANLRLMLAAKRRAVADLESFRQRRLGELQAQLAEYKATYTAAHPLIQGTRESMEALSRESPQLATLRREEQELVAQVAILAGAGGAEDPSGAVAAALAPTPAPVLLRELRARPARQGDSDDAETLRMRVNYAVQKYEAIVDRIESARIELDTARAAFKYRYTMVRPAEVPKKPIKPNVSLTLLSGVILGAILAFGASAWVESRPPAVASLSPAELKVVPAEARIAAPEGHDDDAPSGTAGPV